MATPCNSMMIFFFCCCWIFLCLGSHSITATSTGRIDLEISKCLKVPYSEFATSIKSAIDAIRQVTSVVSQFANAFNDFRLSTAISDCLDLLDFSADNLDWSLYVPNNPNAKNNISSGDTSSDMRTWLSAALANQETCTDGFDGTNNFVVKNLVAGSITQLTSLIQQLLSMVHNNYEDVIPATTSSSTRLSSFTKNNHRHQFPSWIKPNERKLVQSSSSTPASVAVTVALDGSGNYTSIMEAVLGAPDNSTQRYVIYIKRGIYTENVEIKKKKWNLMMIGDGMDATIISGNRSFIDGWTTFRSATFAVSGRGFIARDMTFENTAGPEKHQAVALRSDSDLAVYYRCSIKGYQDTLYTHTMRQFFRECRITGTVDFIFGDATVVFQNCQIMAKKGLPNQKNTITAQGRKSPDQPTGFSIQFCNISADSDLLASSSSMNSSSIMTYLGRPWKLYSRTIVMQSYISNVLRPEGWLEWNGNFALDTLFYGEYLNYGPGATLAGRVKWPGFRAINQTSQANNFTVTQMIKGNLWLPSTGVRYTAGLGV